MKNIIAFALGLGACLLFSVLIPGCSNPAQSLKADRVLLESKEGQKTLWFVCDFDDYGTGKYLSASIYHNASTAIRLAEKNGIVGESINFVVRGGPDPGPSGDSYATSVDELKKFQKMNSEEFAQFASKSILWSVGLKIPEQNVAEIDPSK